MEYPFSSVIIIGIWVLCFIDIPETPLSEVRFIDKWTHSAMYLILGLSISLEYLRTKRRGSYRTLVLWAGLMPAVMGGFIEILQANCTGGRRSGEWLDFLADSAGTVTALAIGILLVRCRARF
ncbi:VanZ family protein [Prevotella denticola]|uniref:VanZ family protein n=1 Tax=Prevotella denticola TaxID=28129 RepID=UPI003C770956